MTHANDVEVLREVIRLAGAPHPFYLRKSGREALSRLLAVLEERDQPSNAACQLPVSPADGLPDGWVAVPREPTDEMLAAGRDATFERTSWGLLYAYRTMLDAAPPVPKGREDE